MELASHEPGNVPKTYSMNMAKDFIPMCVFSETSQGEWPCIGGWLGCTLWWSFSLSPQLFFCKSLLLRGHNWGEW